jgi:hypothetical protein
MAYPIYKKDGACLTCILSSTRFIQVDTSANIYSISAGNSSHMVTDALQGEDMPNGNHFQSAYRVAKDQIQTAITESIDYLMQKFPQS